ncbi:MAG: hypothetical protein KJN73_11755 [Acidimicrobiia bacterium]|nr:hypothetical protein [Acidimicrobiia bacterium]MBT8248482.1 hypothetical protein [Acidimicrobiia bacterium]NNJ47604.1 hypothetical protein [Acidimicrobiia bacterium]
MADDLAFLFNDPAPVPGRPAATADAGFGEQAAPRQARQLAADIDWMTLRQAHDRTSIPISTLRKWARKGKVRARLARIDGKELRFVAFDDIVDRAKSLDRVVVDIREPVAERAESPSPAAGVEAHIEPVATVESVSKEPPPVTEAEPEPPQAQIAPTVPEGSILVPIDAWDRLLGQLGNLHEAGQQLADARERAAKAETESDFLKERLREMRKRAEQAELALDVHSAAELLPEAPPPTEPVLRIGWRRFRDRWLGR